MKRVTIHLLHADQTARFAAQELARYLTLLDGVQATVEAATGYVPGAHGLWLGLLDQVGVAARPGEDPALDDRIYLHTHGLDGVIAGANPRAMLIAVYRWLEAAGCHWIRPGPNGSVIPRTDLSALRVQLDQTPAYRYRGMCIEGAVSLEHMLDSIDWVVKLGMNSYFIEFMVPFTFFDRWYRCLNNPYRTPQPLTVEQVLEFRRQMEAEIAKRGLLYHAAGHGWTCEPFGIPGRGWDPAECPLSGEIRSYLAEIDGQREIWEGIPLNTNLCYSNPQARQRVVEYAVRYAQKHPAIRFLHIWLADDSNNHCECPRCREVRPSDLYIQLLNEMDAAFTAQGLSTRLALIAYLDLLWPPERERLRHPDRFVLLFAPISRSYSKPYDVDTDHITLQPYRRNRLRFPTDIAENLAYLKAWQAQFAGDCFTYEYHFMWDHYFDPAYYEAARVLHEDVRRLRQVNLKGIISDQTQRAYFPTAFGMHVLARTLWDDRVEFDALAEAHFAAEFGRDGPLVRDYLARLSTLFDPPYLRGDVVDGQAVADHGDSHTWILEGGRPALSRQAADRLGQIPGVIEAFRPIIERNLEDGDPCRARSWLHLARHAEIARRLALAFKARAEGDMMTAQARWAETADLAQRWEDELHPVLDVFEFVETLGRQFGAISA